MDSCGDDWDIPKKYKTIYAQGLRGKHITAENEKYVVKLRNTLSTLNDKTYEAYFHHLLWFEEATARACLQANGGTEGLSCNCPASSLDKDAFLTSFFNGISSGVIFMTADVKHAVITLNNLNCYISGACSSKTVGDMEKVYRIKKQSVERVKVQNTNTGNLYTIMVPGMEQKQRYVRIDDHVLLIPLLDPTRRLRARIQKITGNQLTIRMQITSVSNLSISGDVFKLVFLFSNFQYECMHKAVNDMASSKHKTKVFPKKNKFNKKIRILTWFNPEISRNAEQRTAVEHIVSRTSVPAPYILHGPPGTGKTATIVEAILQVLRMDPSSKIMVCTPSNSAADDVACKLIKYESLSSVELGLFLLRQNSSKRDWSTLPTSLKKYSNDRIKKVSVDSKLHWDNIREKERMRVKSTNIIISTISYACFAVGGEKYICPHITHLFIDEAAQATEPLCLLPIKKLLVPDGLLILSGDQMQLGPVLTSKHAQEYGLGISLMERLMAMEDGLYKTNDPNYTVMLKKNFRSHPDILRIPNDQFYNGQLVACANEDVISRRNILGKSNGCRAIAFYAVLGHEAQEKQSSSYFNVKELQFLTFCIKKITSGKHKEEAEDIGIITPYTAQVNKIKKWLDSKGLGKIEVGSVESYQGREKKIILMSTVRGQGADSSKKGKLGFVADSKRFNVALTRAKAKLIVIGNPHCLKHDKLWRIYIKTCGEIGSHYRAYEINTSERKTLHNLTTGIRNMEINH